MSELLKRIFCTGTVKASKCPTDRKMGRKASKSVFQQSPQKQMGSFSLLYVKHIDIVLKMLASEEETRKRNRKWRS